MSLPPTARPSVIAWLMAVSLVMGAAQTVAADEPTGAEQRPLESADVLVWGARACFLEAGWAEADCRALMWVAMKQAAIAKRPWFEVLRSYSALSASLPRTREISQYPWGDIPGKSEAFNQRWARLRALVEAIAAHREPDPCPSALHWGGQMDHPRGRMIPAHCTVRTTNVFYALKHR